MNTNANETRLEGANWDEPVVKVRRNGNMGNVKRKVLTKGVKVLNVGAVLKQVKELLRQGYEVRLADDYGMDAVRLFPLAKPDCKSMYAAAQTMGTFRQCLMGKKLRVRHGEHEIKSAEAAAMVKEAAVRKEQNDKRMWITPDTVVRCPKCGTEFRVGRPNNNKE